MADEPTTAFSGPHTDEVSTASPAPATVTRRIMHEEASDLPEPKKVWPSLLVTVISMWCLFLVHVIVNKSVDVGLLRETSRNLIYVIALCIFVFVAGATATDVVKLVGAIRTTRKETITTEVGEKQS